MTEVRESISSRREIDTADDECHAQHVNQEVIGVDELAPIFVGQKSADDGTEGGTQAVGTDEVEPAEMHLSEAQVFLP